METSLSLLDRLSSGGEQSDEDWQRLVDLYQPLLRAWLARAGIAAFSADADDLIQEVLMVVFREVCAFEWRGPGAFRAWLRVILVNRVRDYFRSRQHSPHATGDSAFLRRLEELESPHSEFSALWDREHDEHVVATLLRQVEPTFSPVTWRAFSRYVMEDVPAGTVATELGLSLNSVLLAKSRVLKRLREVLGRLID